MQKTQAVARVLIPGDQFDVRGRSIVYLIVRLVEFWGRHRVTLAPVFADAVISALDALSAVVTQALSANPPGPD